MDKYSFYHTIVFLKTKSADITLNVFKTYHNEVEWQTSKKLKHVRLDIGREWYNKAWEEYKKQYELIFEFITPYVYQQNRIAERSLWTILDGVRTAMAESGQMQSRQQYISGT